MKKKDLLLTIIKIIGIVILLTLSENSEVIGRYNAITYIYGYIGSITYIILWIIFILSFITISFLPNLFIRMIYTIIFFLMTIIGTAYFNISGSAITYDNFVVLIDNLNYSGDAISQYQNNILIAILIAISSFTFLLPVPKINIFLNKYNKYFYILPLIPFILMLIITIIKNGYGIHSMPLQYRIPVLATYYGIETLRYETVIRDSIKIKPITGEKPLDIVLIVDESVRGDFIDINGENMGITPSLYKNQDRIINFGYSSSGANCSAESNQILRFGPNPEKFEETFNHNPYIWNYAQKAGYQTILIEGQAKKGTLNNKISTDELKNINTIINLNNGESRETDLNIAKKIKQLLSSEHTKPLFIYVVKHGIHFPFDVKVPKDKRRYEIKGDAYNPKTKEDLINSYKNAINYIIDPFFEELITNNTFNNSVIFYTSDHGQNLKDNGLNLTHCSTRNTSIYEGLVPLIIITDDKENKKLLEKAAIKNIDKTSHYNIFPTILNILGYKSEVITKRHSQTIFDDLNDQQKFITGLLRVNRTGISKNNNWVDIQENKDIK